MVKRSGAERAEKKRAFAVAYETPGPTFHNATESYIQAVEPAASRETAAKGGARYLRDEQVQAYITEVGRRSEAINGMTKAEYVQHCLDMEKRMIALAEKDSRGAAMAAARYAEHAGKALGYFIRVTRDETPGVRLTLPQSRSDWKQLRDGADLMLALSQPNPLPPGQQEVEEAEYEVEDATTETGQGSNGASEAPSDD